MFRGPNERVVVTTCRIVDAILAAFLILGCSYLHMYHVSTLFENDRHFSHLSNLEREMTFQSEMGFYFHYYKTIVSAPTFEDGLYQVLHDNKAEFPDIFNAVKRFNLYPEIFIGRLFKIYERITKYYGYKTKQCWQVNRGSSAPPVESCEGLGDPTYFYLQFVWYCAGISKAVLFMYALSLSESVGGALLTILCFLYNHDHCTRIQWAPALRENFAYPFCLLQMLTVTNCLKRNYLDRTLTATQILSITATTVLSLVLWQFSQFVLATQAFLVLVLYCFGLIEKNIAIIILISQMMGVVQATFILFGNELLYQSVLFSMCLGSLLGIMFSPERLPFVSFRGIMVFFSSIILAYSFKIEISYLSDEYDEHVFDILRAKLTNFKNFHTQLYVCSPEFDFLPFSTIFDLSRSGLLPAVSTAIMIVGLRWSHNLSQWRQNLLRSENCIEPHVAYNILQMGIFTIMALFVMRLKLFWTPHMCLITSLIMNSKYNPGTMNSKLSLMALIVAVMSFEGITNIIRQRNIIGEYANLPLEEVLNWINNETHETDVFAGPMSIMANVLLSTGRRIVNHPHYEHPGARERTMKAYSIFSRQSAEEVYARLFSMGANYVILDQSWCFPGSRANCSMVDLWDMTDTKNINNEALCPKLFSGNSTPFVRAFSNEVYVILSLKVKQFVELPLSYYQTEMF